MPKIIENVREQLLREARRQMIEQGYAATTVRSVAGACGLATGTVYNYFESKDMLIASVMAEDWLETLARLRTVDGALLTLLRSIYDELNAFSAKYDSIMSDAAAVKAFLSSGNERHSLLRGQLAELLQPFCAEVEASCFTADFAAEALLAWTMAGKDFDTLSSVLLRVFDTKNKNTI